MKPIIPIYTEAQKNKFADINLSPLTEVIIDGKVFYTQLYAFNQRIDILGLAISDSLVESGYQNRKESIDPVIFLDKIVIKRFNNIHTLHPNNKEISKFRSLSDDMPHLIEVLFEHMSFDITGKINLETGECIVSFISKVAETDEPIIPVGFSLAVNCS